MRYVLGAAFAAALATAGPASAQYYGAPPPPQNQPSQGSPGTTDVGANGNPVTPGSLNFSPAEVSVKVGDVVRWTNTDAFAAHTSTERNNPPLWELTGDYGEPFARGYGPGAQVQRTFEAGTHRYYCRVHEDEMKGTVSVPVTVSTRKVRERVKAKKRRGKRQRRRRARFRRVTYVVATWAPATPAAGLVLDVERRSGSGPWTRLRTGTRQTGARFRAGARGTAWEVRARLRRDGTQDKATDWSPVASVKP